MVLTMNLRFARWAAVSTREQLRPGKFSISNQLEKTLEAATSRGWVETAGPFIVQGQSRETYIDLSEAEQEIPALRQMLQAARLRQFDILVMSETDRLRSLLIQAFRRLASYQVQIYAVNLPIDPVHPNEYNIYKADHVLMMLTMSQMTSSLEISRTRRKWFENMPKRITELGLPATSIAYGYRKPPGSQLDRKAVPEPDPIISQHVIAMKDLLLSGHSTRQIVEYLIESKVKPPKGKKWYPQTVREILRNPFYAGIVRFGASKVVVDPLTDRKKRNRRIPADQVNQGEGRHTPLWDLSVHQLILGELKRRTKQYRGRSNNQFTGLLRCGTCGDPLWRQGNGPRGEHRMIWRCSRNGSARGHINIPHVILIDKIAEKLQGLVPDEALSIEDTKPAPDTTAQQLEKLNAQLTRLEDAYLAGQWDLARYTDRKKQIDEEIQEVREKQFKAEIETVTRQDHTRALQELMSIQDLPRWLKTCDPAEVNQRLHFLIDHISICEEKIDIKLR